MLSYRLLHYHTNGNSRRSSWEGPLVDTPQEKDRFLWRVIPELKGVFDLLKNFDLLLTLTLDLNELLMNIQYQE